MISAKQAATNDAADVCQNNNAHDGKMFVVIGRRASSAPLKAFVAAAINELVAKGKRIECKL